MFLLGLTGGIASGKSTVARRLVEHGAYHIDADELAREALAPGSPALAAVARRFGSNLIDNHGVLDRAALGRIVFADESARKDLEAIVHPEVRRRYQEATAAILARDADAIVVYEIPLLVETESDLPFDLVIAVISGHQRQVERLVRLRGMTHQDATARVDAQATDDQRTRRADITLDSSGSLADTMAQVDALWPEIVARARAQHG